MTKARDLADFVSAGNPLADGIISVSEVDGAAPLASPVFTGTVSAADLSATGTINAAALAATSDIAVPDNGRVVIGDSLDLKLYHDGTNSYIDDTGSGDLLIRGSARVLLRKAGTTDNMLRAEADSFVKLYYANSEKLSTTTTGVDVTGSVTADQFNNDEALPDIRPSLLLDFANSKTLDSRITFTRGSTATYYDGKTFALAEQNLYDYSEAFTTSPWSSIRLNLTGGQTAPDGTTDAFLVEQQTGATLSGNVRVVNKILTVGDQYTESIYAKAGTKTHLRLATGHTSNSETFFNLSNGTIAATGSGVDSAAIEDIGNGWYRCSITFTVVNTNETTYFGVADGVSTTVTDSGGIYLWGAQVEQRSSTAAYTSTSGSRITNYIPVLKTAIAGQARFDHDPVTGESKGLLHEEAETNLVQYSQDGTQWLAPAGGSVRANSVIAPDGTLTGSTLVEDTSTNPHYLRAIVPPPNASSKYTLSVYVKAAGRQYATLNILGTTFDSDDCKTTFNLSTGAIEQSTTGVVASTIEPVGNGWYRCSVTLASGAAPTTSDTEVRVLSNDTGDTTNTKVGIGFDALYVWGFQLEEDNYATSYIPTNGSSVTRARDYFSMSVEDVNDFFRLDEGTLYFEVSKLSNLGRKAGSDYTLRIRDTNNIANVIQFWAWGQDTDAYRFTVSTGIGGNSFDTTYNFTNNELIRVSGTYKTDDFSASFNGSATSVSASGILPRNMDSFETGTHNGHIKKFAYYPKKFSNATVQAMTTE